jgi:hypothetical protein
MGWKLDIAAPANGRIHKAEIVVLNDDGKILFTDAADVTAILERRKLAKRLADRLKDDPVKIEEKLDSAWAAAMNRRRQTQQNAHCERPGRGESGGSGESVSVDGDYRPVITITTEEHLVNAEAVAALTRDGNIYQRGGLLSRVLRDVSPAGKGIRRPLSPRIEPLPPPLLRERMAANARWITRKETKDGVSEVSGRPPGWCVAAVHAWGSWNGIRPLDAVVDYPVLRPDGTILCRPGYDHETGLLLEPGGAFPEIPDCPTRNAALAARDSLLEVVGDFPFGRPVHRAAWLAGLLTPLARFAFSGPAPLFLVDSNVRGAGKGLLLDCVSRIVTGERFTVAAYTSDENELRKRITSLALAGDRLVLFDNLDGAFGNGVLDAALTGMAWKDRVLGINKMAEAPLYMTWYATGNNVLVAADTARRICHVRLESPEEKPEERDDFVRTDLLAWVGSQRGRLLTAALTILRAYFFAGRPDMGLPAWGSFQEWSRLVRAAVVWTDLPDPGQTRLLLQESADVGAESMAVILQCVEGLDPERRGLTSAQIIQRVKDAPEANADLRDALEGLLGKLEARLLGNKLRTYRRRVFRGRYVDQAGIQHQAARWAVFPASEFGRRAEKTPHTPRTLPRGRESGECGESSSFQAEKKSIEHTSGQPSRKSKSTQDLDTSCGCGPTPSPAEECLQPPKKTPPEPRDSSRATRLPPNHETPLPDANDLPRDSDGRIISPYDDGPRTPA